MVAAAERNGRVLDVSYNHRRRGVVKALSAALADGLLGEVYYAKVGWIRRQGIPGLGTWFTRRESAGGGPFMDIGVHMADLGLHLLGEPAVSTVTATTYAEFGPRGRGSWTERDQAGADRDAYDVEDLATAFCRLSTGATLIVEASWAQWIGHDLAFVDLYGTEAGAHLEWSGPQSGEAGLLRIMTDVRGRPAEITPPIPPSGGHDECIADFVTMVRTGTWTAAHGAALLRRAELVDAAYRSAELGAEVALTAG
jgi:predicted dehydrogenase